MTHEENPECKTHPCAPHGFDRSSSHSLDRCVCECEWWEPDETCAALELQATIAAQAAEIEMLNTQNKNILVELADVVQINERLREALIQIERTYYQEVEHPHDPKTIRRMSARMAGIANAALKSEEKDDE
jgi:hypothetical protein